MYCKAIKYGAIPIFNIIQYPVTEYPAGPFRPVPDTRPLEFWYTDPIFFRNPENANSKFSNDNNYHYRISGWPLPASS